MSPKEKAIELYNKFYDMATVVIDIKIKKYVTKQCALVAVDEIIEELIDISKFSESTEIKWRIIWYKSVKEEINKL